VAAISKSVSNGVLSDQRSFRRWSVAAASAEPPPMPDATGRCLVRRSVAPCPAASAVAARRMRLSVDGGSPAAKGPSMARVRVSEAVAVRSSPISVKAAQLARPCAGVQEEVDLGAGAGGEHGHLRHIARRRETLRAVDGLPGPLPAFGHLCPMGKAFVLSHLKVFDVSAFPRRAKVANGRKERLGKGTLTGRSQAWVPGFRCAAPGMTRFLSGR